MTLALLLLVDFTTEVKPLLEKRCLACHGPKLAMRGLRLDSRAAALKGGESGVPAIVPGRSGEGLLLRYVNGEMQDLVMPPTGPRLTDIEIETLRRWIDDGAPFDRDEAQAPAAKSAHWSFQPIANPPIPEVKNRQWIRNPIDAFILSRLESRGWKPNPPAAPRQLMRRLYLDVTGLPPTLAEQEAFQTNPDLDRLARELLQRPTYGERWGRHWLDLVRYAESNGYERDGTKPEAWRYRDYVIGAFNKDKPYDRFILEQLAGDQIADANEESLIATGFNRLGPWDDEPADPEEDRFDQLDDIVSTTSQVFLGLTLGCARCHNHKFDPLTAQDYYSMIAVFNGLQRPRRGRAELPLPLDSIDSPAYGYFMNEPGPAPKTHLLLRGKAARPGPEVHSAAPAVLAPPAFQEHPRVALAKWLASRGNPLTARVIVNRVWQFHFGEGLVRTPSDYGKLGQKPTHPELLDWLATWFVSNGWSIKKLHTLILASNTWRMSKAVTEQYLAEDPEDRLLWRFPYKRLEAEAIRDSMLAVSGKLNPAMGGPSMFPEVPEAAFAGSSDPGKIWKASPEPERNRRTVYAFLKRSLIVPMLEVLDLCDTARSSAQRLTTSVAPQALTLFNGDFVNAQAAAFAARLRAMGTEPASQIDLAYRLALARRPTAGEMERTLNFLKAESLEQVARVILNLNEFVYVD